MTVKLLIPGHYACGSFDAYLQFVNSIPMLDENEEKELFSRYQEHDDLSAAQKIILSHLRFVAHTARHFRGYGLPIEDLVQEGTIGLMKSVKKFDLSVGVRLASFAVHYIKSEIQEYVIRNWRLVKATTTKAKRKLFFNLRRLKKHSDWLSLSDKQHIADELSVSVEDVDDMESQLYQADHFIYSQCEDADKEFCHPNETKLLEDKSQSYCDVLVQSDFTEKAMVRIHAIIREMDERTRDILTQRWLNPEKTPHKVLSEKYGVSQERIRQIEQRGIATLKQQLVEFQLS
ncbi:RNA polymerase factor sigma-32 [Thalassotalea fusca]